MVLHELASTLDRLAELLNRHPDSGLQPDVPARVRWKGGARAVVCHVDGSELVTEVLGGPEVGREAITPSWLVRAGLASCALTSIAMAAAQDGINLEWLEVDVASHSDTRGALGIPGQGGAVVFAGPLDMRLCIRIGARNVAADRLRVLVESAYRRSPMARAIEHAIEIELAIDVADAAAS